MPVDDLPCPALDPTTGTCDLSAAAPSPAAPLAPSPTPPMEPWAPASCYTGAADDQMRACAVEVDPEGREGALLDALAEAGESEMTIVANALTDRV